VPYGTDSRLNGFQAINCLATISSPFGTKVDKSLRDTIHQSLSTKSTPHHSASGFEDEDDDEDSLSDVAFCARWLAVLSASEVGRAKRLVSALQDSFTEELSRRPPQAL
jgi:hypothetical protein